MPISNSDFFPVVNYTNKPQPFGTTQRISYNADINIMTLAKQLGLNPSVLWKYIPPVGSAYDQNGNIDSTPNVNSDWGKGYDINSVFSTIVYNRITLSITDQENVNLSDKNPLILDECFINVDRKKNIVRNVINGMVGTVKEMTSIDDYSIGINGVIVGKNNNEFDKATVQNYISKLNFCDHLYVSSPFLNDIFGITKLVIESGSLGQSTDYNNILIINLSCYSDDYYPVAY